MKKILTVVLCVLALGITAGQAQVRQGQTAVGANLVYGSRTESLGLGARFQYGILDHVRAEVGFNHFFEHNHMAIWDVNLNGHYLIGLLQERLQVYPIGGLNYTMLDYKGIDNYKGEENHIGLNVGAGVEYELTEHLGVNMEYRHTIVRKVAQGVVALGINYKF